MSRVFDALSHVTACSDHSAARAASAKRLCRMCPAGRVEDLSSLIDARYETWQLASSSRRRWHAQLRWQLPEPWQPLRGKTPAKVAPLLRLRRMGPTQQATPGRYLRGAPQGRTDGPYRSCLGGLGRSRSAPRVSSIDETRSAHGSESSGGRSRSPERR